MTLQLRKPIPWGWIYAIKVRTIGWLTQQQVASIQLLCAISPTPKQLMRKLLSLALIVSLFSCDQKQAHKASPVSIDSEVPPPYVSIDTTDGSQFVTVIDENEKSITLSKEELQTIDSLVRLGVAEHNLGETKEQAINLSKYKRQYFVSVNAEGEKEVEVNCFCQVHNNDDWKKRRVSVDDGGACYFHLRLNLATQRVLFFRVNGEA